MIEDPETIKRILLNASIYTRKDDEYTLWVYEEAEKALYAKARGDELIRNPISFIARITHNSELNAWEISWKEGVPHEIRH